mgnify:CR=1 FL=1
MARIELELTAIVYNNSEFSCADYKLCIGGYAKIFVNKEQVADAIFQNPEADEGLFDQAADLFGLQEGTKH